MWYVVTQGLFVSVSAGDPKEDGYYIVKFTFDPYTLQ